MSDKSPYSDTLNLPRTDFPMRAGLPKQEPERLKLWEKEDIYGQLRRARKGKEKFVLHLGPPYANGALHVGHALSYILKDFIVRAKGMKGFDAPYVPGWDCHGLPIEWKVEQELRKKGNNKDDLTAKQLRDLCRAEAEKWIAVQKADWQRFGCIGDFENPYKTMDYKNEAGVVRQLGKLAGKGYLYKGAKSVMWSTVEETALAEAEVEYADKESKAVYVKFPIVNQKDEYVVIWTTTPWTLPANKAVAYGKDVEYTCIEVTQAHEKATVQAGEKLWFARDLLENACNMCGVEAHTVREETVFSEEIAQKTSLAHPFYGTEVPLIEGFHVTTDAGTGFVHIAPSHGQEDFQIGLEHGLDTACHVNGDGTYDETVQPLNKTNKPLAGKDIWAAQGDIIAEMTENKSLLRWYKYKHSYPVSWRSKAPLIFRTTPQWFVQMDGQTHLREDALKEIKNVRWVPEYGENRITGMIANRPDWCISRQRAWGVPITLFVNRSTGEFIKDPDVFEHIAGLIEKEGIDAWNSRLNGREEELFPQGWLASNNLSVENILEDWEPQTDILDVWIDSGTTFAHVVGARAELHAEHLQNGQSDMYLEGSDQHRGWFHSSLLMSTATQGYAPYKQVLTHGFVVDGDGKKMSKSVGNVVAPQTLAEKYGMDIVRLWVAGADYSEDIRMSDEIMRQTADAYRRFRNTFRWLLGNLNGFTENHTVDYKDMPELERYMLHRLHAVLTYVQEDYENYRFHRVFHALHNFCNVELSSFYFDIRKDCLYCDATTSQKRRACQTVLSYILKGLTTHLAPILPFTCDEVWRNFNKEDAQSIHLHGFMEIPPAWHTPGLDERWGEIKKFRDNALLALEKLRTEKVIGANLQAHVALPLTDTLNNLPWDDFLVVSSFEKAGKLSVRAADAQKCPRCWKHVPRSTENPDVCGRCAEALSENMKAKADAA